MTVRRWLVHGAVQGVGFRWFAQRAARRLGLRGFVRNLPDGTVEVVAEGDDAILHALLEVLQRGPGGAVVQRVEHAVAPSPETIPASFEIH